MNLKERKKILREKYDAQLRKIIEEEKAKQNKEKKIKEKELLNILYEIIEKDDALDVFDTINHPTLISLLVGKKGKTGEEILNRINQEKEKIREENRKKRQAKKQLNNEKEEKGDEEKL